MAKGKMSYNRAKTGSSKGISANQWNGFLDMHKDYFNGNAGQGVLPPILQQSTIVTASLHEDSEPIGSYTPVRIVKVLNYTNVLNSMPSYVVEAVDAVDTNGNPRPRHGNYGFTLSEGVSEDGGRVVIAGVALVAVTLDQLEGTDIKNGTVGQGYGIDFTGYKGDFDSSYYVVNDGTLTATQKPEESFIIAPIGHYKVLSWHAPEDAKDSLNEDDEVGYLAIDMSRRGGTCTAMLFDGCASGYNPVGFTENGAAYDKLNLVTAQCLIYSGTTESLDPLPNSYSVIGEEGLGWYGRGGEIVSSVQRSQWDFSAIMVNPTPRGIPSGMLRVRYDADINRLVPQDAPAASVNETSAYVGYSDLGGISIRMGAALDVPERDTHPTIEDFNYNSSKTLAMYLNAGRGADTDTAARGLTAFAANDFLSGATWQDEYDNNEDLIPYRSRYGLVNLSRNVVRGWVLMLDEDHTHAQFYKTATGDSTPTLGTLCSCMWGSYKIINVLQMKSGSGGNSYPQWIEADLAVLDPVRTIATEACISSGTLTGVDAYDFENERRLYYSSSLDARYTKNNTMFPEIDFGDSEGCMVRKRFVDGYPNCVYQCEVHYNIRLNGLLGDEIVVDGTNTLMFDYDSSAQLTAYGVKGDGSRTRIAVHKLENQGLFKKAASDSTAKPTNSHAGTLPFEWTEQYEKIEIRLGWDDAGADSARFYSGIGDFTAQNSLFTGTAMVKLTRQGYADAPTDKIAGSERYSYNFTLPTFPTFGDGSSDLPMSGGV